MCLKVIRSRIISCLVTNSFSWLRSFISIFHFSSTHSLFGFFFFFFHFSTSLTFICTFLLFVGELQTFFFLFSTLAFQHRHSLSVIETRSNPSHSWKLSFFYKCPPVWRMILGRGSERKLLSSKGVANG